MHSFLNSLKTNGALKTASLVLVLAWLSSKITQGILAGRHRRKHSTPLNGPASKSRIFGMARYMGNAEDPAVMYEKWAKEYGSVYTVPAPFGSAKIILVDAKAVAHFFARETYVYVLNGLTKVAIEALFGRGLLWSEGDSHRRQRKALTPAFTNHAIAELTPVFYDSAYKAARAWEELLENDLDGTVIEVQSWMNRISLDSIGIAGFSHDLESLSGKSTPVSEVFESFSMAKQPVWQSILLLLSLAFPILFNLPTPRKRLAKKLSESMRKVSTVLLDRTRQERGAQSEEYGKSIIELLIKSENASEKGLHMTQEEIMAQMNVLLVAGYETTSITLTWILIELCKKPEVQDELRKELLDLSGNDPSWTQFTNSLPYLDAVVHEALRLHPAVTDLARVASQDDVIPLSTPIVTADGHTTDRIHIVKGQSFTVPIACLNRSEAFWGPTAKEFRPERWLVNEDGEMEFSSLAANDLQGHKHLLTFVDGPRKCLGRGFALAETKAVLSVLIRKFKFELPGGHDTVIGGHRSILMRPKVAGEEGADVPLWVRRVD